MNNATRTIFLGLAAVVGLCATGCDALVHIRGVATDGLRAGQYYFSWVGKDDFERLAKNGNGVSGVKLTEYRILDGQHRDYASYISDDAGAIHGYLWISNTREWRLLLTKDGYEPVQFVGTVPEPDPSTRTLYFVATMKHEGR